MRYKVQCYAILIYYTHIDIHAWLCNSLTLTLQMTRYLIFQQTKPFHPFTLPICSVEIPQEWYQNNWRLTNQLFFRASLANASIFIFQTLIALFTCLSTNNLFNASALLHLYLIVCTNNSARLHCICFTSPTCTVSFL